MNNANLPTLFNNNWRTRIIISTIISISSIENESEAALPPNNMAHDYDYEYNNECRLLQRSSTKYPQ
jgi:hypothetical protein